MELGDVEAIERLVAVGLGWSVASAVAVKMERRAGGLSVHALRPRLTRRLALARRRGRRAVRCGGGRPRGAGGVEPAARADFLTRRGLIRYVNMVRVLALALVLLPRRACSDS
jgi:hypothetical protein